MKDILALDLGTNSIGWTLRDPDLFEAEQFTHAGVRIFSKGVGSDKNGNEFSFATVRTKMRSLRKIYRRRRTRKIRLLRLLIEHGMCPLTKDELKKWAEPRRLFSPEYPQSDLFREWLDMNPYELRAQGADPAQRLLPYELGRALYHLCQRRGFKSNADEEDPNSTPKDEQVYNQWVADHPGKTLGQELYSILENARLSGNYARIRGVSRKNDQETAPKKTPENPNENEESQNDPESQTENEEALHKQEDQNEPGTSYSSRKLYKDEFWKICNAQQVAPELAEQLHDEIFHQRPLKGQKGTVGKCKLEAARGKLVEDPKDKRKQKWIWTIGGKNRCHLSHPDYEEFRMWQFLSNVKFRLKGAPTENGLPLTPSMRAAAKRLFYRKNKPTFSFSEIADFLNKEAKKSGVEYNFNYSSNTTVTGCPTCADLADFLGENWLTVEIAYAPKNIPGDHKSGKITCLDVWHVWLDQHGNEEKLAAFARHRLGLTDEKRIEKFSKVRLKKGYADLSLKAIRKILPFLKEQGLVFSHAVFLANLSEVVGKETWEAQGDDLIQEMLRLLRENEETRKLYNAVNAAISRFRRDYQNAAPGYRLDKDDQRELTEELAHAFGTRTWREFPKEKRAGLSQHAMEKYREQLAQGYKNLAFLKLPTIAEAIEEFLINHFGVSDEQLERLYHPSVIEIFQPPVVKDGVLVPGSPRTPSVRNPMVMRTLHELRYLLKELLAENIIGRDTVLVVEMARDLNDANRRKAIEERQNERERENRTFEAAIAELFKEKGISALPQPADIEKFRLWTEQIEDRDAVKEIMRAKDVAKYRLWQEQNGVCIYTGKQISLSDLFNGEKFDFEHTFPRSKTNDNSLENLTVTDSDFNRNVKKGSPPFEAYESGTPWEKERVLQRIQHWKKEIDRLEYLIYQRRTPHGYEPKEVKDKRIKERHKLKLSLDYWRSKYERFTAEEIKPGFANRQLVDTGIITKYALAYLRSMFGNVRAVKGSITAEFRKAWGLQEEHEKKSRDTHLHHLIDAMVIAAMDREKYDLMAQLYAAEERMDKRREKELKEKMKPWQNFDADVRRLAEDVLVSHAHRDNFAKQTKRKLRKRGKVVLNENKKPIILQGQGVRARLHEDTFYGAIKRPGSEEIKYVKRESVSSLEPADFTRIVDEQLRKDFQNGVIKIFPAERKAWRVLPDGKPDRSKLPILKLRMFASVSNPLELNKRQSHKSLTKSHPHKEKYYVKNEGNYELLIFQKENKGKLHRKIKALNYLEAAELYAKIKEFEPSSLRSDLEGYSLFAKLRMNRMVLCYEKHPEEIQWSHSADLSGRLYQIKGIESDGRLSLKLHKEARNDKKLKEDLKKRLGESYEESWVKGKPKFEHARLYPKLRLSPSNFSFLVQDVHFILSPAGKILSLAK